MFFAIILFSVIALAAAWLLRGGHAWARPVALASALLTIIFAALSLFRAPAPTGVDWRDLYERGYYAAGLVMGETLAIRFPEGRIAAVLRPLAEGERTLNAYEDARLKGLRDGVGTHRTLDHIYLPFGTSLQARYPDPIAYQTMLTSGELRAAINDAAQGYDVIVLGSDFPEAWDHPNRLRGPFALVAFDLPADLAQSLIRAGVVDITVSPRPDGMVWKNPPAEPQALFERLYALQQSDSSTPGRR